ncbi:unnamed protein product [Linum tenue]|uniref:HMA domain-containing protein n=2 Tax=Linum tenue TaxID=586396 RepID=A0AAV0NRF4_9ROSI|nr:unnamed protein product [Linum tenue]
MRVNIDCAGCEMKVKNALQKLEGVDEVEIDTVMQKVTVTGWADQKKVLKRVRRTGRRAELWQLPYNQGRYSSTSSHYYDQHQVSGPLTYHAPPQPSSSYNYYKHGSDDNHHHGYYRHPAIHSTVDFDGRHSAAGTFFSDDNPHACSLM